MKTIRFGAGMLGLRVMHSLLAFLVSVGVAAAELSSADLLAPRLELSYRVEGLPGDWRSENAPSGVSIASDAARSGAFRLEPAEGKPWDLSAWSHLALRVTNRGESLLWIEGRLDNERALPWANSTSSQLFLLPGETGSLGFAYPRPGVDDESPPIFSGMNGKLNGWRTHWKAFNPSRVLRLNLRAHSARPGLSFEMQKLATAWPYGGEANAELEQLPFLDKLGQVKRLTWPGKVASVEELNARHAEDAQRLKEAAPPEGRNKFGGWENGPELEATGHFRLAQHEGKWWLVDPEGRLFWSHGVCSVGFSAGTPILDRKDLFEWLPAENDPLYPSAITGEGDWTKVDFLRANLHRVHGPDWSGAARELVHRRFKTWGLNTFGAWSDGGLEAEGKTPYTPVFHLGGARLGHGLPQPFGGALEKELRNTLVKFVEERGQDPWVVGVFIDNEIHWNDLKVGTLLALTRDHPAKQGAVAALQARYESVDDFNRKHGTKFASWKSVTSSVDHDWIWSAEEDAEAIESAFVAEYYRVCRDTLREVMPDKLYLGSRIHTCPEFVARIAAEYVDVFSVNHYWNVAGLGRAPGDVNVPVMVTEFHFGALDRGVPGASLSPVHDQLMRARAYQNYVASALKHPRVVGTHWFAWTDQSSAGRPGENYQIGFLDITGLPYPEFTRATAEVGRRLYEIRAGGKQGHLLSLEELVRSTRVSD